MAARPPGTRLTWALAIAGVASALAFPPVAGAGGRKVIIDQDSFGPGGSDIQGLLAVLGAPDVEVLGITVESGDGWRDENVAHTLRLLELVGRTDVPVVPGSVLPLLNSAEATKRWEARYGRLVYKGAWTEEWPKGTPYRLAAHAPEFVPALLEGEPAARPLSEPAPSFLVRKVKEFPGEVSILALGPQTNLALAVRLDETFPRLAKELVFMGGSFRPKPADNDFAKEYLYTPRLEFNFRWDPEAAQVVLHAPWRRLIQVPVDATTGTMFTEELKARIAVGDSPAARYVAQWGIPLPMWDEVAAGAWLDPSLVSRRTTLLVDVDTDHGAGYGNTLSWPPGGGPGLGEREVDVVLDIDVPRFEAWCVTALAGTRKSAPLLPR